MNKIFLYYFLFFILLLFTSLSLFENYIQLSYLALANLNYTDKNIKGRITYLDKDKDMLILLGKDKEKYYIYLENDEPLEVYDFVNVDISVRDINIKNSYEFYIFNVFGVTKIGYLLSLKERYKEKNFFIFFIQRLMFVSNSLKEKIVKLVKSNLSPPYESIILRLTLGYKDLEIKEILKYFQDAGVMHVLVVSGLHVGLVYLLAYYFLKLFPFLPINFRIFLSLISVLIFMFIAGFSSPIVRATIITICFSFANFLKRTQSTLHSLVLAALVLLIFNSKNLFNPSFQLSFFACFGIAYFYKPFYLKLKEYIENTFWVVNKTIKIFLLTLSAQIMLIPLLMLYFNKISIISFLSNIFIIPFATFLLWLSLIYYILSFIFNSIPYSLWIILEKLTFLFVSTVKFFAYIPFSVFKTPSPSFVNIFLYYVFVLPITYFLKINKPKLAFILFCFGLVSLFLNFKTRIFKVSFLNVGLGDAIFIKAEDKNILIDAGDSPQTAYFNILPYLKKEKVKKIDYFILTHAHYQHYGGAKILIENFKIKNIYINNFIPQNKEYKTLLKELYNSNLFVVNSKINIKFNDGEIQILPNYQKFLLTDEIEFVDENSILVKLNYKNFTILLTNDLPAKYLNSFYKDENNLIIQIPRHGKYEEDLEVLSKFHIPKFYVVSTDKFYFSKKILKAPVFSTEDGIIEIKFSKLDGRIKKIKKSYKKTIIEM